MSLEITDTHGKVRTVEFKDSKWLIYPSTGGTPKVLIGIEEDREKLKTKLLEFGKNSSGSEARVQQLINEDIERKLTSEEFRGKHFFLLDEASSRDMIHSIVSQKNQMVNAFANTAGKTKHIAIINQLTS